MINPEGLVGFRLHLPFSESNRHAATRPEAPPSSPPLPTRKNEQVLRFFFCVWQAPVGIKHQGPLPNTRLLFSAKSLGAGAQSAGPWPAADLFFLFRVGFISPFLCDRERRL